MTNPIVRDASVTALTRLNRAFGFEWTGVIKDVINPLWLGSARKANFFTPHNKHKSGQGKPQVSFQGERYGRLSNLLASASPWMTSLAASHLIFRPTNKEISPKWPGIAE